MLKGLYTTALSMAVLGRMQEASANNLANCNTSGYKKDTVVAQSFPDMLISRLNDGKAEARVGNLSMGVWVADVATDFSPGITRSTENPLQLSLYGEGYFAVQAPQGERYTRCGDFKLSPEGVIVTADGYPLLGDNGAITVSGGEFTVDAQGCVFSGGRLVDRLKIVAFDSPPVKEGSALFWGEDIRRLETPHVVQASLEGSNAESIREMVKMLEIMRAYEANQKVMHTHDATLEKAVNEIARL